MRCAPPSWSDVWKRTSGWSRKWWSNASSSVRPKACGGSLTTRRLPVTRSQSDSVVISEATSCGRWRTPRRANSPGVGQPSPIARSATKAARSARSASAIDRPSRTPERVFSAARQRRTMPVMDTTPPLANAPLTTILPVRDLDRARRFYVDTLGLTPVGARRDGQFVLRAGDGSHVSLFRKPEGTRAEHTALSFEVGDLDGAIARLEARGVAFHDYDLPGFRTIDRVCALPGERCAWFSDPEGNVL